MDRKETGCMCDFCVHYDWDEEGEYYECNMSLDEDEMGAIVSGLKKDCPYYRYYDEYKSVHKQI